MTDAGTGVCYEERPAGSESIIGGWSFNCPVAWASSLPGLDSGLFRAAAQAATKYREPPVPVPADDKVSALADAGTAGFYWGAATAAFQIEGAPLADGAASSDWYEMTQMPGVIHGGDTADVACDHYRRWPEDVELMRRIGLNAYRFSIAWPRVYNAPHRLNPPGLAFYDRLVDALLEAKITPFPTIFHWEMPKWLDDQGGWLCADAPAHFAEYAETLFERLGDRVTHWITLNEPLSYYHSYITGFHWPFRENAYGDLLTCLDNQLRAHQAAAKALRARGDAQVGMVMSYNLVRPAADTDRDRLAARRADGVRNRWLLDRVTAGTYPEDILRLYGGHVPNQARERLDTVSGAELDFIGLNYYASAAVAFDADVPVYQYSDGEPLDELQPTVAADPEGLSAMVERVHREYGPCDLYITENGWLEYESEYEVRAPAADCERVDYLARHLAEVEKCVRAGLPLRGYFHWSLLDNFEWRWGLSRRYGLIHVDRETQDRRLKDSARFYRDYIRGACDREAAAKRRP